VDNVPLKLVPAMQSAQPESAMSEPGTKPRLGGQFSLLWAKQAVV
jgi:hypothetical protein